MLAALDESRVKCNLLLLHPYCHVSRFGSQFALKLSSGFPQNINHFVKVLIRHHRFLTPHLQKVLNFLAYCGLLLPFEISHLFFRLLKLVLKVSSVFFKLFENVFRSLHIAVKLFKQWVLPMFFLLLCVSLPGHDLVCCLLHLSFHLSLFVSFLRATLLLSQFFHSVFEG